MTKEQIEADIKRIKDANAEDEGLCKALSWILHTAEPGLHQCQIDSIPGSFDTLYIFVRQLPLLMPNYANKS